MVSLWIVRVLHKEWRDSIGNILFMVLSVVLCQVCVRIMAVAYRIGTGSPEWWAGMEELSGDMFLQDKAGMITTIVTLLAGIVAVFGLTVMIIKINADLCRLDRMAAIFEMTGDNYVYRKMMWWKVIETTVCVCIGILFTIAIWDYLIQQVNLVKVTREAVENIAITVSAMAVLQPVIAGVAVLHHEKKVKKKSLAERIQEEN